MKIPLSTLQNSVELKTIKNGTQYKMFTAGWLDSRKKFLNEIKGIFNRWSLNKILKIC
jgi:hypothetical protein